MAVRLVGLAQVKSGTSGDGEGGGATARVSRSKTGSLYPLCHFQAPRVQDGGPFTSTKSLTEHIHGQSFSLSRSGHNVYSDEVFGRDKEAAVSGEEASSPAVKNANMCKSRNYQLPRLRAELISHP